MAVRKAGARYVVELQTGGVRVFRRLPPWATKADAQALEAKIRRELWERDSLGRKDEPSLAAAIQLWLNATEAGRKDKRNPRLNAVHLRPFVEGKTIRQVGEAAQASISRWASAMSTSPRTGLDKCGDGTGAKGTGTKDTEHGHLSAATINRRLDVLRAAVRWSWKQGLVSDNLSGRVPRLREENARQVYLTAGQIRLLVKSSPSTLVGAAIMIAAYTGLRASELLALTPASLQKGSLVVAKTKTGRPRSVPVVPLLRPYLSALPLGCSYRRLIGWFWEARKKANLEHVHWHDLRHTFSSLYLKANPGDLPGLMKLLGHTTIITTMRYSHIDDRQTRKGMARIGR